MKEGYVDLKVGRVICDAIMWAVEAENEHGEIEKSSFSGPQSHERAMYCAVNYYEINLEDKWSIEPDLYHVNIPPPKRS